MERGQVGCRNGLIRIVNVAATGKYTFHEVDQKGLKCNME